MAIDTKKFAIVIGAALVLQAATVGAIATGGTAIAVPTAGVGGFTVTFDQLEGQGFTQYASLENSSECGAYPSAVAKINQGSIKGLKMYKDVEIPKGMPGGGTTVRLMITSDKTVKFRGMTQKFTYLQGNLKMEDQKTLSDPNNMKSSFSLSAPSIVIDDGRIKAQSQFLQSITLSGAHVKTVVNPKNTTSFPKSQCAAGGN